MVDEWLSYTELPERNLIGPTPDNRRNFRTREGDLSAFTASAHGRHATAAGPSRVRSDGGVRHGQQFKSIGRSAGAAGAGWRVLLAGGVRDQRAPGSRTLRGRTPQRPGAGQLDGRAGRVARAGSQGGGGRAALGGGTHARRSGGRVHACAGRPGACLAGGLVAGIVFARGRWLGRRGRGVRAGVFNAPVVPGCFSGPCEWSCRVCQGECT